MKTDRPTLSYKLQSTKSYDAVFYTLKHLLEKKDHFIVSDLYDNGYIKANPGLVHCFLGVDIEVNIKKGDYTEININYSKCDSFLKRYFVRKNGWQLMKELKFNLN